MELVIGLIIGSVLGLTGAGGAAFALPLLVLAIGMPVQQAIGLSLATVAIGAGYGSLQRAQRGDIFWWGVAILGIGGVLMAPVGKYLATFVPDIYLLAGFCALTVLIAAQMWWRCQAEGGFSKNQICHFDAAGHFEPDARSVGALAVSGMGVGSLAGFFGVGGGFLIVPLLHSVMGLSMHRAIASSLFVITCISLSGFFAHTLLAPVIDWQQVLWLGFGAVLGMLVGTHIASFLNNTILQRGFALALVAITLATLWTKTTL